MKGYTASDMFKLNVNNSPSGAMNVSTYMFVYSVSSLWHNRPGHFNYKRLKRCQDLS